MKITDEMLDELSNENRLADAVINDINDIEEDDRESYIEDVITHGCQSGIVSDLIYYKDTVRFYDNYREEIWDLLDEKAQENSVDIMNFIASLNGSENVGSHDQLLNLLAWFAYEETMYQIANELELDL